MPEVRLVGRRYTDADRGPNGTFGHLWQEWFANGYFDRLEGLPQLRDERNGYLGAVPQGKEFEYWIGVLTIGDSPVPEGFESVPIPAGEMAVCWLRGREETGELYGCEPYHMCVREVGAQGWAVDPKGWFFERYNCPRFTDPDSEGRVVLDYCFYLAD